MEEPYLLIPDAMLAAALGVMVYKLTRGIPFANAGNTGYRLVVIGSAIVFLASILDLANNITWVQSQLFWLGLGDTDPLVVIFGIVPGVGFIAIGLAKWLPSLFQLDQEIERRKIVEAELIIEKERAQAANLAKSEFLANMSHEIRTPMNGVMGMIELALGCDVPERARSHLEVGAKSGQTLMTIINDILDLSRMEAGYLEIEIRRNVLLPLVREVIDMFEHEASNKGIKINLLVDGALTEEVLIDATRYRQVMFNLIGNAIKFSSDADIDVTCTVAEGPDGKQVLITSVRDHGIGIPAKAIPHLFDRFSQGDNSVTRLHGGTGLGLAICKQLSGLMGGSIEVESTPGQGSEFSFVLPLKRFEEETGDTLSQSDRMTSAN